MATTRTLGITDNCILKTAYAKTYGMAKEFVTSSFT
jgi:hypothetical protein